MSIEISTVDPADEDAIRDYYDSYLACNRHDWANFVAPPPEQLRRMIRQPTEDFRYTAFLARDDNGTIVGQGWYAAYRRANRDKAIGTPRVLPQYRRRGTGSALLARLEEQARVDGRTVLQGGARWGLESGPAGTGSPGVEFARKHGGADQRGHGGSQRSAPLPGCRVRRRGRETPDAMSTVTVATCRFPVRPW